MTKISPPSHQMLAVSASVLGFLLCVAILIMWVPGLWIVPTFFQAGLFMLGGFWAIRMAYRPYAIQPSFVLLPLAATVGWPLLQLTIHSTVSRWETWYAAFTWAGNFTACFLALQICQTPATRRRLLHVLLMFGFGISIVSTLQYFSAPHLIFGVFEDPGRSVFGPFTSYDRFAMFAELVMPIAVIRAFQQKDTRKALWFVAIAATLFAAVIAGGSRTGAVLIVLEAVILPAVARYKGDFELQRVKLTTAKFALAAVVFTLVVGYTFLFQRFEEQDPYAGRRGMLLGTMKMIEQRPWLGFGLGNFENAYRGYAVFESAKIVNHAHNDWAEWAAEGGMPFLIIMLSIAVWTVQKASRSLWAVGILAVFAHSLVDFPLQNPTLEFWVFALLGILAAETASAPNPT